MCKVYRWMANANRSNLWLGACPVPTCKPETGLKGRLRRYWWARVIKDTIKIVRQNPAAKLVKAFSEDLEGDDDVVYLELGVGRLIGLLRLRSRYGSLRFDIARAPW
jgi:hypothetical protein